MDELDGSIQSSEFILNRAFNPQLNFIKVFTSSYEEKKGEQSESSRIDVINKVKDDRKYIFQAIISKLIKSYKRLSHLELYQKTVEASKIPIDDVSFKGIIKTLVEKDIMKEVENEPNMYIYT